MQDENMNSTHKWPTLLKRWAAICVALGALAACGGAGSGTAELSGQDLQKDIQLAASKPGDVVSYAQKRVLEAGMQMPKFGDVTTAIATAGNLTSAADTSAAFSGTTVQEKGVDEHDWMKTDGTQLFALQPGYYKNREGRLDYIPARLVAQQRLQNGSLSTANTLDLSDQEAMTGLYFAPQAARLTILSEPSQVVSTINPLPIPNGTPTAISSASIAPYVKTQVGMRILPATTTGTLTVTHHIKIDGNLIGSRQIGNYLYVVSQWSPNLERFYEVTPQGTTLSTARLNSMTAADLMPTLQLGSNAPEPLHAETDCYVQSANASPYVQFTSLTVFDLGTPHLTRASKCFMGAAQALYMSSQSIYLSTSRNYSNPWSNFISRVDDDASTDIHKFSVSGMSINYKASGEVKGHLGWDREKASYRMSEYQGDLRVITFTGSTGWTGPVPLTTASATPTVTASPATLSILRESAGGRLSLVGSLPNAQNPAPLGKPGEQVYAVKFVGARAYVVTFRRIDPLYVLDLSNPAAPKAVGELEMPGYSDYLFPIGDSLLLGVGQDANAAGQTTGVKLALMNVANPAQPTLLSSVVKGGTGSDSALNFSPRGITLMQRNGSMRVALPIRVNNLSSPGALMPQSQGLYRFEIDTNVPPAQARLVDKPAFGEVKFVNGQGWSSYDIAYERSMLIEEDVIYFSSGQLTGGRW
jgi:Beta propeller domain